MPETQSYDNGQSFPIQLNLTAEQLRVVQDLAKELGSPTLGTAFFNAVLLVLDLYAWKRQNWELRLVKGSDSRRFNLP